MINISFMHRIYSKERRKKMNTSIVLYDEQPTHFFSIFYPQSLLYRLHLIMILKICYTYLYIYIILI